MIENALYYCRSKVAKPGSDWYYCLRNVPLPRAHLILALLTLVQDWHDIPFLVQDHHVALAKFAWWRQELQKAFDGMPEHPATQLFMASHGEKYITRSELSSVLIAYQQQLSPVFYQTSEEWQKQPLLKHDMLSLVASKILASENLPKAYVQQLAEACFIVASIVELRKALIIGICPFAISDLAQHKIAIQQLQALQETDALIALMKQYAERALAAFINLPQLLSKQQRIEQKPLLRYAKLQRALLIEIMRDNFPVLQSQILLTPLRKFWLTCR